MTGPHGRLSRAPAWIALLAVVALIAGHGGVLRYVSRHWALPGILVGVIVLVVIVLHLGLLAPIVAMFRRPRRGGHRDPPSP